MTIKRAVIPMIYKSLEPLRLTSKLMFNIIFSFTLLYFIFHTVYGDRGIISYFKLQAELKESNIQLKKLKTQRLEIENGTRLLRSGSLDRDMLDEKIRNVLGLSRPREKIFKPQLIN